MRKIKIAGKIILPTVLAILVIFLVYQFNNKRIAQSELKEFFYSFGSYHGGYWDYNIYPVVDEFGEKRFRLRANASNGYYLDIDEYVDEKVLLDISKIVNENEIYKWNGFNFSNNNVLDGYGFRIELLYNKGNISARAYHNTPSNYEEGHNELRKYLNDLTNNILINNSILNYVNYQYETEDEKEYVYDLYTGYDQEKNVYTDKGFLDIYINDVKQKEVAVDNTVLLGFNDIVKNNDLSENDNNPYSSRLTLGYENGEIYVIWINEELHKIILEYFANIE